MTELATLADLFASTPKTSTSALPRQPVAPVQSKSQKFGEVVGRIADVFAAMGGRPMGYATGMAQNEARTRQQAQQNLFATLYNDPTNQFAKQDFLSAGGDIKDIAALEQMNAPAQPKPFQLGNRLVEYTGPGQARVLVDAPAEAPKPVYRSTPGGGTAVIGPDGRIQQLIPGRFAPSGGGGGNTRAAPKPATGPTVPGFDPKVVQAADKNFTTKVYTPWVLEGGRAEALRRVEQLKAVRDMIARNPDIVGGLSGYLPDTARSLVNREGLTAQQQFEEVVQSNLRQVLGGQFAMKEGEGVLARAFDPKAPAADNLTRLDRLLGQITAAIQAKDEAVQRFEQSGTSVRPRGAGGVAQPTVTPTATDAQGRKIMWNGTAWVPMR